MRACGDGMSETQSPLHPSTAACSPWGARRNGVHHRCPGVEALTSALPSTFHTRPHRHRAHEEKGREEPLPPLIKARDVPSYRGGGRPHRCSREVQPASLLSREVGGLYHCSGEAGGGRRPFPAAREEGVAGFKWGLRLIAGGWRLSGSRIAKRKKGTCRKLFYQSPGFMLVMIKCPLRI